MTGTADNQPAADEKAGIVSEVANFIRRFVYFERAEFYTLLAVWIIGTHCYELFDYYGYLFIYSPLRHSGKSRLLEVLDLEVANSSGILDSPTEATLFRTACKRTQLLDEADNWKNQDDFRAILNSGFQKTGKVPRMERGKGDKWEAHTYSTFAPRAIAGIGVDILSDTTRDRTFVIPMVRQRISERREKLRLRTMGDDAARMKEQICNWVNENKSAVEYAYRETFPILEHLGDRSVDISEPLFAICSVAEPSARIHLLRAIEFSREEDSEVGEALTILQRLNRLPENPVVGTAAELVSRAGNFFELRPEQITAALRAFGFATRTVHLKGDGGRKRYVLPKERIAELLNRYTGEEI